MFLEIAHDRHKEIRRLRRDTENIDIGLVQQVSERLSCRATAFGVRHAKANLAQHNSGDPDLLSRADDMTAATS